MAKGIEIGVAVDTKAAKRGIETGLIEPMEDAQEALEDLGKDKGPEQLERNLKGAQDASERLQKETKETADIIEREYRDAYRKQKQAAQDGMRGSSEATGEFKQEFKQNLSEVTSSFDGSMDSIQDLAQGTFGGLASSLTGPVGAAAAGVAVGVGLIGGAMQGVQEETEKSKQRASEWAEAFIEAGGRVLTAAQTTEAGLDIITDPEKYQTAKDNAEKWGISVSTAIAAMTGQQWALEAAQAAVDKQSEQARKNAAAAAAEKRDLTKAEIDYLSTAVDGATVLRNLNAEMDSGAKQADEYSRYLVDMAQHTDGVKKSVDEFGDSLYALPDGTTIYVDAETGRATQDVDQIEKKIYGLPANTTVSVGVDTRAAEKRIQEFIRKDRTIHVSIAGKPYGRY